MLQRIEQLAALRQALQATDGDALTAAELLVRLIDAVVDHLRLGHIDDAFVRHRRAGADEEVVVDLRRHVLEQLAAQGEQGAVGGDHAAGAVLDPAQPAFVMPIEAVADAQATAGDRDHHVPGAGADLRIAQRREQVAEGVARPLVVGIGEHQNVAGAQRDAGIQRRGFALARQVEHGDARVDDFVRAGHGVIGRAVAGENDLQRGGLIILGQQRAQLVLDVPRLVVRGNHDADVQRRRRRVTPGREQRRQQRQQQRIAEVGVDRQQQAHPENEFSHGQASWHSNDTD